MACISQGGNKEGVYMSNAHYEFQLLREAARSIIIEYFLIDLRKNIRIASQCRRDISTFVKEGNGSLKEDSQFFPVY